MVTDCLKGVLTKPWGTGRVAAIGWPAAGKTGTTDDWRDAWFVGCTPQLVTAVWMGCDKEKTLPSGTRGGGYPARWRPGSAGGRCCLRRTSGRGSDLAALSGPAALRRALSGPPVGVLHDETGHPAYEPGGGYEQQLGQHGAQEPGEG